MTLCKLLAFEEINRDFLKSMPLRSSPIHTRYAAIERQKPNNFIAIGNLHNEISL